MEGQSDSRIRLQQRRPGTTVTFREVVEELAAEKGIVFQPRKMVEGKQTFWFGSSAVYLESNVAFALSKGDWVPVSLEELASKEAATAD
jgi:hypothetical protein